MYVKPTAVSAPAVLPKRVSGTAPAPQSWVVVRPDVKKPDVKQPDVKQSALSTDDGPTAASPSSQLSLTPDAQALLDEYVKALLSTPAGIKRKGWSTALANAIPIDNTVYTGNAVQDLARLNQGTAANTRLGSAIRAKCLYLRVEVNTSGQTLLPADMSAHSPTVRAFVFADKMPLAQNIPGGGSGTGGQRATFAAVDPMIGTDIGAVYSASAATTPEQVIHLAQRNMVTMPRYHVYEEKRHTFNPMGIAPCNVITTIPGLDATASVYQPPYSHIFDFKIKFDGPGLLINWYNVADPGSWLKNSLHLGIQVTTTTSNYLTFRYASYLEFEDEQDD